MSGVTGAAGPAASTAAALPWSGSFAAPRGVVARVSSSGAVQIEPEPFAHQHVLIVGGGNAAADCAIALANARLCASVSISYRRPELARLRASVRKDMERCFAEGSIVPLLATEVVSIEERHVTLKTPDGVRQLINDRVIVQVGGQPPSELLRTIGIELVEKRGEA